MKNIIITINTTKYEVSEDIAKSIATICQSMGKEVTTKVETKAETQSTTEDRKPFYTVKGKTVTVGGDNVFVPRKVFYGITMSIKEHGGKWNATKKVWEFADDKSVKAWVKAQENRNK